MHLFVLGERHWPAKCDVRNSMAVLIKNRSTRKANQYYEKVKKDSCQRCILIVGCRLSKVFKEGGKQKCVWGESCHHCEGLTEKEGEEQVICYRQHSPSEKK